MAAVDTPYDQRIIWTHYRLEGRSEGRSPLGRYVYLRNSRGLWDGTFYDHNGVKVADMGTDLTDGEAYHRAVDDNKERLNVESAGLPGPRRRPPPPLCPKCNTEHAGDECW
jgi:hypothetical protein